MQGENTGRGQAAGAREPGNGRSQRRSISGAGTGTVLVVDDDSQVRRLIKRVLEPLGCPVLEASDGESALELIAMAYPTVVLLDLYMPGLDGLEVLERINALGCGSAVFAISADSRPENESRALGLGAVEYVRKPFRPAQLRELVAGALAVGGR